MQDLIENPTCGKVDRCKHAVDCPYNWRPVLSGLCFERKKLSHYYHKRKTSTPTVGEHKKLDTITGGSLWKH